MEERDGIQLNIKEEVTKKVRKWVLLYNLGMLGIFVLGFGPMLWNNTMFQKKSDYIVLIILILAVINSNYLVRFGLRKAFEIEEERKISKQIVEDQLSDNEFIQVFPNEVPLRYCTFIKTEIPTFADFFAILGADYSGVKIYIKLKGDNTYHFLEHVDKEDFFTAYSIK